MHYFEYATKDTTLYSRSGSQNTGIDEIIEVVKDVSAAGVVQGISRVLIKFDTTYISSSVSSGLIPSSSYTKFYLNLYDANSNGLNVNQNLFETPYWMINKEILNKIEYAGTTERIRSLQSGYLNRILDFGRMARMIENEALNGSSAYSIGEMMDDLKMEQSPPGWLMEMIELHSGLFFLIYGIFS